MKVYRNDILFFSIVNIIFLSSVIPIKAQENYQIIRIAYNYDETNYFDQKKSNDIFYLDISKSICRFKSAITMAKDSIIDVGIKKGNDLYEILDEMKKLPKSSHEEIYTYSTHIYTYEYFMDYVYYKEKCPDIVWEKINNHTKQIIGYPCKQAKTMLYGREWVVYYTEDIPLPYGPWKLAGLPGLITEAYTTDSCYRFTMIGFETIQTNKEINLPKKATKLSEYKEISKKEYLKLHHTSSVNPQLLKEKRGIQSNKPDPIKYQKYQKRQEERYQYIEKE